MATKEEATRAGLASGLSHASITKDVVLEWFKTAWPRAPYYPDHSKCL